MKHAMFSVLAGLCWPLVSAAGPVNIESVAVTHTSAGDQHLVIRGTGLKNKAASVVTLGATTLTVLSAQEDKIVALCPGTPARCYDDNTNKLSVATYQRNFPQPDKPILVSSETWGYGGPPRKGDRGEQGIPGQQGEQGVQGIQGIAGKDGAKGDRGERGERGEQGVQGIQGIQGKQGIQGRQGEKGEQGDRGPAVKTVAVCSKGTAKGQGQCSCAVRAVAIATSVECEAVADSGKCSAHGDEVSGKGVESQCCVCSP